MRKKIYLVNFLFVLIWITTSLTVSANSRIYPLYNSDFITIEQMDGVSNELLDQTRQTLNLTQQYFRMNFDIPLSTSVMIVVTPNKNVFRDQLIEKFRYNESQAEHLANNSSGIAGGHVIVINADSSMQGRSYIMVHELTHIYQGQLAGSQRGAAMWIMEGLANTIAAKIADYEGHEKLDNYQRKLQKEFSLTIRPNLDELIARNDWRACLDKYGYRITYQTASYAALLLTERFGERRVMKFFAELGQGATSDISFQNSFGISIADFISDFERMSP